MPQRLLRFSSDDLPSWIERSDDGRLGPLRAGWPPAGGDATLWLVVPAEEVLLLTVARPPGSARQMAQALPFAIEDRLATAVEAQHVSWAPGADAGSVNVAVLDRRRMRHWLDRLAAAGLLPDALVPEPLLLPWSPGRAALLVEEGRAVLRYGPMQAFCGRPEEVSELRLASDSAVDSVPPADALRRMAEAMAGPAPINLLQGEFEPARRREASQAPWRWAAGLAVAGLALLLLFAVAERWALSAKVTAQRQEMAELYRMAVPGATRVVDAEQQLRAALGAAAGNGGEALRLLATAAPVLAAAVGVQLDAFDYRAGQLELVVLAPDVARLDALRSQFQAAGLRAELSAATPGSRGVEGRVMLRPGA